MRLPNRKPGKYTFAQFDPTMTEDKLKALQTKLNRIKKVSLPQAIKDTQTYGENGDFSENAEYQIAKGRLRGLLKAVDELQRQISQAVIIQPVLNNTTVQIGHSVTITTSGITTTYKILGPVEANPGAGIISHKSPLGLALLGHKVGDMITVLVGQKKQHYTIITIQ